MKEGDALALCVSEEARGEIPDGQAAVARIIKNRMRLHFESDGTLLGTIFKKDQFSWAWFGFEKPHTGLGVHDIAKPGYIRIAHTTTEAYGVADDLLTLTPPHQLTLCGDIAQLVMSGAYSGTLYDQLTDDAVNYCNPRILTKIPRWAIPSAKVCSIGHHDFYRNVPAGAPILA
jgi:hypothetical protein